jgi:hypothetical protein
MNTPEKDVDADESPDEATAGVDPRLLTLVKEYQAALDAGTHPDREALLARCPELAGQLREYLDAIDMVQAAAPRLHLDAHQDRNPNSPPPEDRSRG